MAPIPLRFAFLSRFAANALARDPKRDKMTASAPIRTSSRDGRGSFASAVIRLPSSFSLNRFRTIFFESSRFFSDKYSGTVRPSPRACLLMRSTFLTEGGPGPFMSFCTWPATRNVFARSWLISSLRKSDTISE